MSGRRQHYLPRFLQRAFRFRGEGDGALVYAHERDRVYTPNVIGLGQERDFYGHPDDSGLDAAITATEARLADTHRALLTDDWEEVPIASIGTLVSAVSMRTKSMREAMTALGPVLMKALGEHFKSEAVLREGFRREAANPRLFRDSVADQLAKMPHMNRNKRAAFVAFARREWEKMRVQKEDEFVRGIARDAATLVSLLRDRASEMADGAFIKALTKDPELPLRAERFAQFQYSIARAAGEDFYVLGDCGVVGIYSDCVPRLAIGDFDDAAVLDAIVLPLSPYRCLVGKRIPIDLDTAPAAVNQVSASLSHRFFVSNQGDSESLQGLREKIGTVAPIATEDRILGLLRASRTADED